MRRESVEESRAMTAAMLLTLLKQNGCSAREAAGYVSVSPTTMSHWHGVASAQGKSIGAPTDEQLERLVGLFMMKLRDNQNAMMHFASSEYFRLREKALLLKSVIPLQEQTLTFLRQQQSSLDETKAKLLELQERIPREHWKSLFGPIYVAWGTEWPTEEQLASMEPTVDGFDPDETLSAIDVSDADVEKLKTDYEEYTQRLQNQIRAMITRKRKATEPKK